MRLSSNKKVNMHANKINLKGKIKENRLVGKITASIYIPAGSYLPVAPDSNYPPYRICFFFLACLRQARTNRTVQKVRYVTERIRTVRSTNSSRGSTYSYEFPGILPYEFRNYSGFFFFLTSHRRRPYELFRIPD